MAEGAGITVTVKFEKTSSTGLEMTSTLTGTSTTLFSDSTRLPTLYIVADNTDCSNLPANPSVLSLTTYDDSPETKTDTIEGLTFSFLDTSCLIIWQSNTDRSIDDRLTIETVSSSKTVSSASFDTIGCGGEPAIEAPTTTTST